MRVRKKYFDEEKKFPLIPKLQNIDPGTELVKSFWWTNVIAY